MRRVVREGKLLGLFVEGTRQRSGVPGKAQAGAAMVVALFILVYIPAITLWVPQLAGYVPEGTFH